MMKGTSSNWNLLNCGVPQGLVLALLLFLIYINDLVDIINKCSINLFADGTCIYYSSKDNELCTKIINKDLENAILWSNRWLVDFIHDKTLSVLISNKNLNVFIGNIKIKEVKQHKHLGMLISNDLC